MRLSLYTSKHALTAGGRAAPAFLLPSFSLPAELAALWYAVDPECVEDASEWTLSAVGDGGSAVCASATEDDGPTLAATGKAGGCCCRVGGVRAAPGLPAALPHEEVVAPRTPGPALLRAAAALLAMARACDLAL